MPFVLADGLGPAARLEVALVSEAESLDEDIARPRPCAGGEGSTDTEGIRVDGMGCWTMAVGSGR